jgi:hypothetical protein
MPTLYDISTALRELEAKLLDNAGEIPDEAFEACLDAAADQRDQKLDGYCALIRELEERANARSNEANRLQQLAAADQQAAERLRSRLKWFFERHQLPKVETMHFRISLQNNGGVLPLHIPQAWETEPASAPEVFHRRSIQLDRELLRKTVTRFYARAEEVTAGAQTEQERRRLFAAWLERDEEARQTYAQIAGCSLGERGRRIVIR